MKTKLHNSNFKVSRNLLILIVLLIISYFVYQNYMWTEVKSNYLIEEELNKYSVREAIVKVIGDYKIVSNFELLEYEGNGKLLRTKNYDKRSYLDIILKQTKVNNSIYYKISKYKYTTPKDKNMFLVELVADSIRAKDINAYLNLFSEKFNKEHYYLKRFKSEDINDCKLEDYIKIKKENNKNPNQNQVALIKYFTNNTLEYNVSVESYEIENYENSYIIEYSMIDSLNNRYYKHERLTLCSSNGKMYVATQYRPYTSWSNDKKN